MVFYTYYIVDDKYGGLIFTNQGFQKLILPRKRKREVKEAILREFPESIYRRHAGRLLKAGLRRYFKGQPVDFRIKLDLSSCSSFQRRVYASILSVPYGETRSYKWLATQMGNGSAARAVGRALKSNPIPIIIPCHRIIKSDGSLGGYAGGVEWKKRLLKLEAKGTSGYEDSGIPRYRIPDC